MDAKDIPANNQGLPVDVPIPTCTSGEMSSLLDSSDGHKAYKRRWYVLLVFSLMSLMQFAIWNCYGPIAQSAIEVFGWSNATIGMFANWGNIMVVVFMIPVAWIMDVKGLRIAIILSSILSAVGAGLKCITSEPIAATWLANIGSILNGIALTVTSSGSALVSVTWFLPKQRATATAIGAGSGYMGVAISFIMGPWLAPKSSSARNWTEIIYFNKSNLILAKDLAPQRDGIMRLMYLEGLISAVLCVMTLLYFPSKPPSPPSATASLERTSYVDALKALIKHKRFILLLLAFCIPTGVLAGFSAVLEVNLKPVHVSQVDAGWIGFYSTAAGCVFALIISRIADMFLRHIKAILLIIFIQASAATVWFILLRFSYIPFSMVSLYISSILLGLFVNGSVPLFYELGCEASYPIAEGVTVGALIMFNNLTGSMLLSVLQIPNIGVVWMNWVMLGSVVITIPLLLAFKEHYARINIDTQEIVIAPPGDHIDMPNEKGVINYNTLSKSEENLIGAE